MVYIWTQLPCRIDEVLGCETWWVSHFGNPFTAVWANITLTPPPSCPAPPPFIQRSIQVSPPRRSAGDGQSWFYMLDAPNKMYKNTARTTTSINVFNVLRLLSLGRVRGASSCVKGPSQEKDLLHNFIWLGQSQCRGLSCRGVLWKRPKFQPRGKSSLSLSEPLP